MPRPNMRTSYNLHWYNNVCYNSHLSCLRQAAPAGYIFLEQKVKTTLVDAAKRMAALKWHANHILVLQVMMHASINLVLLWRH